MDLNSDPHGPKMLDPDQQWPKVLDPGPLCSDTYCTVSGLTLNGCLAGKKAEELALISELQEHVKSTTAPYKYPRKIDLVDSLPKVIVSASQIVFKTLST